MYQQVIIITGTSKGIGYYLANSYLQAGHFVVGCSRSSSNIRHENYRHFELDVTDETSVASMVRKVKKEFCNIHVLLNNAGIASMNHCLTTPSETVQKIFSVNVFGSFYFLRDVGKQMIRNKYGRIVNYTTVANPLQLEGEALYASSKAALETLTKISAKELGDFGVTVNCIGPTPIDTELTRAVPKNKLQDIVQRQAIKRMGKYEDVKNVIDFFIDEKSDFVSGQILYLGGVS